MAKRLIDIYLYACANFTRRRSDMVAGQVISRAAGTSVQYVRESMDQDIKLKDAVGV